MCFKIRHGLNWIIILEIGVVISLLR
jgi:hypothetical protein